MKIWIWPIVILIILASLFWAYHEGIKEGEKIQIIKQQEQKIEVQNEVIETKKFQQKIISKTAVNIDAASRDKWVQLIFQERATAER